MGATNLLTLGALPGLLWRLKFARTFFARALAPQGDANLAAATIPEQQLRWCYQRKEVWKNSHLTNSHHQKN